MSQAIPRMSDDELRRWAPGEQEAGFGALSTEAGLLPLRVMEVSARITGLLAETSVRQTFVNNLGSPLEASYIFPLPDRAAVTGFRMEVKGRIVEGVIKERGEAREEYQRAIRAGHRAAITEEERSGVFTMRVGNIPPGEEVTVQLRLCAQLPFEQGEATFRFPLVVAPRYIPGRPLEENVGDGVAQDTDAVPDASRITPPVLLPGYPNPVRLQLSVAIDPAGVTLGDLRSSLHVVAEERRGEHLYRQPAWEGSQYRVALRPGERLNRDFILRFRLGEGAVRTGLTLRPDSDGDEGTFLLAFWPPATLQESLRARDVVFVLDRSGSMEGWKMVAARRAVARMIDTLRGEDRFAVYAFDDRIETPPSMQGHDLVPASDRNRYRAVEFLARLEARGGTEMAKPLREGAQRLRGGYQDRDRVLVLVTDGQVGNEDQILRMLADPLRGTRVFTLGVDQAVNEGFLRRLAALGAGACELVESEDRLDDVMQKVHRRIGTPLIADIEIEPVGLQVIPESVTPSRSPDLFPGTPLFVTGRFRGPASGSLRLRGRQPGGLGWSEEVVCRGSSNAALPAIWARAHLRELEDRYEIDEDDHPRLERQIVETSVRFGVLSRFTAFIAVDRSEVVNPGGRGRRVLQPVEQPEGWEMDACARPQAAPQARSAMSIEYDMDEFNMADAALEELPSMDRQACSAPAPASPSRRPPVLARLAYSGFLPGGGVEQKSDSLPALDLQPYRERAAALLARLDRQATGDRLVLEARTLLVELEPLVQDLQSVGAPEALLQSLREQLKALQELVTGTEAKRAAAIWQRALEVLEAFARGAEPDPPKRRSFWKR